MAKPSILIFDDERRWRYELQGVLRDAGMDCDAVALGEVAIETVRQDHGHKIKLVLADELLLEPDVPDGARQHCQGSDVRKKINGFRPDIRFIVISDLPRLAALEHNESEQAAIAALAKRDELSDGVNVIAMFDKVSLASPKTSQDRYKALIKRIRDALGEPKANIKPALYIGLGIERSQYEEMAKESAIKKGEEFRLYQLSEKHSSDRRRCVDEFLRKKAFGKGVKQFLEALAQEAVGAKKPERTLDYGPVKYIRTFIRKPNSTKLLPSSMKVGSSEFRVFFMLAYRAEKGESALIREKDYIYEERKGQVPGVGAGVSQYSLNQSAGDAYGFIDESEDSPEELIQRYVAEDVVYEIDKGSGRRKRKAEITKEQSKLKLPIMRARDYLKEQGLGTLNLESEVDNSSEKLGVIYVPEGFVTGIILYPVDVEAVPK